MVCHLRCLLLDCCEEIRRHCEDREYCWRAPSRHVRVIDLAGAATDMITTGAGVFREEISIQVDSCL